MPELITGRNAVREMLRAGRSLNKILLAENAGGPVISEILALARARQVPVQRVPRFVLDKLAANHQGVIGERAARDYVELEQLLALSRQGERLPFLVMLDGVQDPQNLGAIMRSAEAAGAHGIILPRRRGVGLTPAVDRASAGASAFLPVARVTNLARCLEELQGAGLWAIGADPRGETLVFAADFSLPLVLVLGGEGQGLSRLVREKCDFLVRLPMFGRVNSLNVSAAAAILFYEVVRQRHLVPGKFSPEPK
ncbi:MAG: rRNA (guanosine2251-2-O)-methyltransferase [Clostridia bacterium]|nr:rRNA (guanosine2251-2-O)-methyltransferase [Clostridia bacterium]